MSSPRPRGWHAASEDRNGKRFPTRFSEGGRRTPKEGHFSLYRVRPDFPQFVAKVTGRDGIDRWPLVVRTKRGRHDCLINGIEQFARPLEILGFDLVEHLGQHLGLVRRRRTLPGVDTIYGRVEAPINALDKEIIFYA